MQCKFREGVEGNAEENHRIRSRREELRDPEDRAGRRKRNGRSRGHFCRKRDQQKVEEDSLGSLGCGREWRGRGIQKCTLRLDVDEEVGR